MYVCNLYKYQVFSSSLEQEGKTTYCMYLYRLHTYIHTLCVSQQVSSGSGGLHLYSVDGRCKARDQDHVIDDSIKSRLHACIGKT